jgi:hypothetical protein
MSEEQTTAITEERGKIEGIMENEKALHPFESCDAPIHQTQSKKRDMIEKLLLCIALFCPLFLATLDITIVATALPRICPCDHTL